MRNEISKSVEIRIAFPWWGNRKVQNWKGIVSFGVSDRNHDSNSLVSMSAAAETLFGVKYCSSLEVTTNSWTLPFCQSLGRSSRVRHQKFLILGWPQAAQAHVSRKPTINSWTRHALCDSVLSYGRNRWKFQTKSINLLQKSPETTTDTQGMSKFYWFYF